MQSGSSRPRRRAARFARLAPALFGLAVLAGCGTLSSLNPFSSGPTGPAAACPAAVILRALRQTAVFAPGAAPEPIGVAFYGILDDVSAKCEEQGGALRVALDVIVIGERGPAVRGATAVDLPYFIAVVGPNQAILRKQSFTVHIDIPQGKPRAGVTDHIVETIPLAGAPPGQLTIDLGFQQTPQVVDFYHHFRGP